MTNNYGSKLSERRWSRRRAIAAFGSAAAATAFLAACGGDDGSHEDDAGTKDASGLVTQPSDDTKSLKRGGVLVNRTTSEPNTLEPHLFPGNFTSQDIYSGLWLIKDGYLQHTSGEIEGDVVESW